jgi:hypothetical protein
LCFCKRIKAFDRKPFAGKSQVFDESQCNFKLIFIFDPPFCLTTTIRHYLQSVASNILTRLGDKFHLKPYTAFAHQPCFQTIQHFFNNQLYHMRKTTIFLACLLALALVFSCQPNKQQTVGKPVTLESRTIQQKKGTDCDKQPDSLRTDCAIIDFSVPKIQGAGAQSALGKSMDAWADKFLIHLLTWTDYNEAGKEPKTVEAAIQRFRAIHDENEGSVFSGMFTANCTSSELLNDGKYLTLQLDGYSFLGGNRATHETAIATFDVKTGKQLTWDDLVKDKAALLAITEASVRANNEEEFNKGFKFDKEEPLALPRAYGLTTDGIVMFYHPDEIYGLGTETVFTILYDELGNNLKLAAPIATKAADLDEDILALYEIRGNDVVIFPFEIEVSNSAKAEKTLTGKKETLIVSAHFWGEPTDPKEKAKGEDGMVVFVNKDIELTGNERVARFEGLTFNKALLSKVTDKDIFLNVNVFSGRKSSKDNLLTCGILDTKVSQVVNKRYVLGCQLISEPVKVGPNMANPVACFALPDAGTAPKGSLSFLVNCDSVGKISFADTPMKDLDALKAALRPLLKDWIKEDANNLPGIETEGCMMGNSGAIRDMYEELVAEMGGKAKPTEMEKDDEKISDKKGSNEKPPSKTTLPKGLAGVYKSAEKGCPMELKIASKDKGYTFSLKEGKKQHTGTLKSEEQNQLIFKGLLGAEPKVEVEGILDDGKIRIQNTGNSSNQFTVFKGCDVKYIELAKTTENKPVTEDKASTPAPAKGGTTPVITLNEKGEITLNGKKVSLENFRKELQNALLANPTIPDKIDLKTIGQTGMGMRADVNTTIGEAIAGAKWVRKKAAIAALNTAIGKKLATPTQLELGSYQISGNFVLIGAKPKRADGKAIDYSKTDYAKEAKTATFVNNVFGLLRYQDGAWKVLASSIGTSKAPLDTWMKSYQIPKTLSGKSN